MTERRENQMMSYLCRVKRMDEIRLTKKLYVVGIMENLPTNEEEIDESPQIQNGIIICIYNYYRYIPNFH